MTISENDRTGLIPIMRRLTLLMLTAFAMSLSVQASATKQLNDITLPNIQGVNLKLSTYTSRGQWVVLNIWGTRCPPCREEMPELVSFHDQYNTTNAIVVGIAIDFPSFGPAIKSDVIAFADDYLIDFPVFLSDGRITEKLGLGRLEALPTTYLIDPEGNVSAMQVGAITKASIEKHINDKDINTPQTTGETMK